MSSQEQIKLKQFEGLQEKQLQFPELWTQSQVFIWLDSIGMSCYRESFEEMKVDGLIIMDLNESDLQNELNVSKKLH